ncbi:hypothetical protein VCR15J5_40124 [Vibrio crassostreae]|nr:hypothetical protein VCR15J5_40124 [Vibrio crassostreae]
MSVSEISQLFGYFLFALSEVEYHTVLPGVAHPVIAPVLAQWIVRSLPSGSWISVRKRL